MSPTLLRSMRPSLLGLFVSSRRHAASLAKPSSPLQKRDVAGGFIFRPAEDSSDGWVQVALFRRSAKVRTYQHKWAPISGSVEASDGDPLATAWRELAEETGLTPESVRFLRRGKPYSYADESVGRQWTINPFAFVLESGADSSIRLDWEHEAYDWFNPARLLTNRGLESVPRLTDSLRRVWFELELGPGPATAALERGLRDLRSVDDGPDSSTLRGRKALAAFLNVLAALDAPSTERWWRNMRLAAWHLIYNGTQQVDTHVVQVLTDLMIAIESRLPSEKTLPYDFAYYIYETMSRRAQGYGPGNAVGQEDEEGWGEGGEMPHEQEAQKQRGKGNGQVVEAEVDPEVGGESWDTRTETRAERFFSDLYD